MLAVDLEFISFSMTGLRFIPSLTTIRAHDFSQLAFTEDVNIDGVAYTGNLGMIVRLFKIMRVGASIQFPTSYKIQESYYNTLTSQFENGDTYPVCPTDARW